MGTSLAQTEQELIKQMEQAVTAAVGGDDATGGLPILKLSKAGLWVYGGDDVEVEEGSRWAVNPASFATGFISWASSKVLGEELALVTEAQVVESTLPDTGADWKRQIAFQIKCVDGEDEGVELIYKASSKGGKDAFKTLFNAVLAKRKAGATKTTPLIELEVGGYKHPQFGKVNTPTFVVVDWIETAGAAPAEVETPAEVEAPVEVEPAKKPRRTRKRAA